MLRSISREAAVFAAMWLTCACGGGDTCRPITDSPRTEARDTDETAIQATSTAAMPEETDAAADSSPEAAVTPEKGDTGSPPSASCGGRQCDAGQSCIEYFGIAGKPLYTCGIPCKSGAPEDACPKGMRCRVIPDGPTQCIKP